MQKLMKYIHNAIQVIASLIMVIVFIISFFIGIVLVRNELDKKIETIPCSYFANATIEEMPARCVSSFIRK